MLKTTGKIGTIYSITPMEDLEYCDINFTEAKQIELEKMDIHYPVGHKGCSCGLISELEIEQSKVIDEINWQCPISTSAIQYLILNQVNVATLLKIMPGRYKITFDYEITSADLRILRPLIMNLVENNTDAIQSPEIWDSINRDNSYSIGIMNIIAG